MPKEQNALIPHNCILLKIPHETYGESQIISGVEILRLLTMVSYYYTKNKRPCFTKHQKRWDIAGIQIWDEVLVSR